MNDSKTLFIAHRGASYDAPENTLTAVNLAWQLNADGVEIDIQLTKDKRIVVFHDYDRARFGGNKTRIFDLTWEELRTLDVGKFIGQQWIAAKIPTLSEVLQTVPENKLLLIEIKCGAEILPVLERDLKHSPLKSDQIIFICFDRDIIKKVKKKFSSYRALRLYELSRDLKKGWQPSVEHMLNEVLEDGLDGLDVSSCPAINESFISQVKSANLLLYIWTVNNSKTGKYLFDLKVDGITTDRPHWLKQHIQVQSKRYNI